MMMRNQLDDQDTDLDSSEVSKSLKIFNIQYLDYPEMPNKQFIQ